MKLPSLTQMFTLLYRNLYSAADWMKWEQSQENWAEEPNNMNSQRMKMSFRFMWQRTNPNSLNLGAKWSRSSPGNYTLMVADCLPRLLMEGDWPDSTDKVDRSIFPALSFVILHHLDIKVTHLSVSVELKTSFQSMNSVLCHRREKVSVEREETKSELLIIRNGSSIKWTHTMIQFLFSTVQ